MDSTGYIEHLYNECPNIFAKEAEVKYDIKAEKGPNEVDSRWTNTGYVLFNITSKRKFGNTNVEFRVPSECAQNFEIDLANEFEQWSMIPWGEKDENES